MKISKIPNHSKMLLTLEADFNPNMIRLRSCLDTLIGTTKRIPKESFDKIINGILDIDFDSVVRWHDFETFNIESDGDGYLVGLELKVNYEVLRGEVVNDVVFSIDEMIVYDNEGDEMVIDYVQAEQIKQVVESKNYLA